MLIVQKHYLKEFFKVLTLVAVGLAFIFSILELIDKIDDFLPYRPSLENLALYVVYNFPRYFLYLLPMAILLCSLFIFSQAKRREEITAIKASGGRLRTLLIPFVTAGLLLSAFGFAMGEFVVPDFSRKAQELKEAITRKGKNFSFKEGTVWLRAADGSIVKIGLYMPGRNISKNISIFKVKGGRLIERIEAQDAEWTGDNSAGRWKLKKAAIYKIEDASLRKFDELEYPFMEPPSLFDKGIQKPEEMGIGELLRYTKKLEDAGFRNLNLIVDLNAKVSYPFINFFMILLGVSLPMRGRTGGGLVMTATGIAISLIYWFGHAMSLSMGYAGILPPVVATWIVPLIFAAISVKLFSGIKE